MRLTITGPRSVGKTAVSKIVAQKLGLEYIFSDEIGEKAFAEHGGLDAAIKSGKAEELIRKGSYKLIMVVYNDKDNFVFDLSGGAFSSTRLAEASEKIRIVAKEIEGKAFLFSDVKRDLGETGSKLVRYLFNRGILKTCDSK